MLHNILRLVLIKVITERMQKSFVITLQITETLANEIWLLTSAVIVNLELDEKFLYLKWLSIGSMSKTVQCQSP